MKKKKQIKDQTLKYHHTLNEELQGRLEGGSFLEYIQAIFTEGLLSIIITNMHKSGEGLKYVVRINPKKLEIAERDKGQELFYKYDFVEEAYYINQERQETLNKAHLIEKINNILKDINLLNARVFEEHIKKNPETKMPPPTITKRHTVKIKKPRIQTSERRRRYQRDRQSVKNPPKLEPVTIEKSWWEIFNEKLRGIVK